MVGTLPELAGLAHGFDQGRFFTDEENERVAHVAVLGYDLAHALFPSGEADGRTFMLDGAEFTVIGVYAKAKADFSDRTSRIRLLRCRSDCGIAVSATGSLYDHGEGAAGKRQDAFDEVDVLCGASVD